MVSNSMLKFIDQRLQELTGTRIPFGGKSIIAIGDLYQLKPVAESWIFQDLTHDASALASNLWQDHFSMFELTEIMRQKNDNKFAELLNRLRHNKMTDHDKEQIQQCQVDPNSVTYPQNAPHIFAENCFMQAFNEKIINNINSQKVEISCHDSVVGANIPQDRQNDILKRLPRDACSTMGLHYSLTVVVGMLYDLTVNIDTENELTNGASCVVKDIEYKQAETNKPSIIWVRFDNPLIGNERRKKYHSRGFYHHLIDDSWTPIFDIERTFPLRQNTIQRIQFPLQPSAGRTVHRAQGTTLDQVVIDLSQRKL
ncbi:ATP-dependent DNA helicase pif1-like [Mercenaria mercenaria]|uniref:ATP-dependent DNA helicase pif1-like n=1 Tax=Mercenaria mercenaria TaxID=6596 RepID=UPI00234ED56C|nr:ATP-dependent DNA helicase pif1-like [Mercenaria mercenaria]